ncbi:MAG: DUF4231 domain-containing protein [Leptothrix sp. (in: b-proteobacteria)]
MSTPEYPVPEPIAAHPAWFRLEDQLAYYESKAGRYQRVYKRIKLALIGLSASIPVLAFVPLPQLWGQFLVAGSGALLACLEGVLLLNQYPDLWVKYRGTAESLKRERWSLLSRAGEYRDLDDATALRLLAERIETLLDVEHSAWTEEQKQALSQLSNTQNWLQTRREEVQANLAGAAITAPLAATDSRPSAAVEPAQP